MTSDKLSLSIKGNRPGTAEIEELRRSLEEYRKEKDREITFSSALRERIDDIPLLVNHFLEQAASALHKPVPTVPRELYTLLATYHFPGNIRELRNAIERAVVMGNGKTIMPEDLPIADALPKFAGLKVGLTLDEALNEFKKEFILLNLRHTGGNRSKASKVMDIQRTFLSRLITRYDIRDLA